MGRGVHRGFITYEELGKSLGKRNCNHDNLEKAFLHIFDNKVSLVQKKSDFQSNKKRENIAIKIEGNKVVAEKKVIYLRVVCDPNVFFLLSLIENIFLQLLIVALI